MCALYIFFLAVFIVYADSQKLAEQKIESYESCSDDIDCKENSFCYGNDDDIKGKCKCKSGFELSRNRTFYECLAPSSLDDACEKDFQCQVSAGPMAVCNKYKICQCNEISHKYTDGVCYKSVRLTEFCLSDSNCKLDDGIFAFCINGTCECGSKQRPSTTLTKCLISVNLGDICRSDEECQGIPNTVCQEVCRCRVGYSLSRDAKSCLKAALEFGEPCVEDAQCTNYLSGSICKGDCTCLEGFHGFGSKCRKTSRRGEACEETADCIFDKKLENNVECTKSVCSCIYGKSNDIYGCKLEKGGSGFLKNSHTLLFVSFLVISLVNRNII